LLLRNWLFELLVLELSPLRSANKEVELAAVFMLPFKETELGMKGLDWLLGDVVMACME